MCADGKFTQRVNRPSVTWGRAAANHDQERNRDSVRQYILITLKTLHQERELASRQSNIFKPAATIANYRA
jgi:hypothetical protein